MAVIHGPRPAGKSTAATREVGMHPLARCEVAQSIMPERDLGSILPGGVRPSSVVSSSCEKLGQRREA